MPASDLFLLDTSYLDALVTTNDDHHDLAVTWTRCLEQRHARFLTHEGILTEIGDGFSRPGRRNTGIHLVACSKCMTGIKPGNVDAGKPL
ncbi:MAG: hypothetical protein HY814_13675 [Candidatus Riflebacteria bacterium]|nr:hypothetical protein [Candidatus Riflebacteria bacterium]